LVIGNLSLLPGGERPQKRPTMIEFWEFVIFLVNSIVFLLLGDQVLFPYFLEHIDTSLVAIAAVLASRAVAIFGFSALSGLLTRNPIPWAEQTVLWWVGLRGSVAIALALSLPALIGDRQQIISNSFGVVLFTLLVQGLTTKPLLDSLNLLEDNQIHTQYLELEAQKAALTQVLNHLSQDPIRITISPDRFQQEIDGVKKQLQGVQEAMIEFQVANPQIEDLILQRHQEKLLAIETSTYATFIQEGWLKDSPLPIVQQVLRSLNLQKPTSQE
ncbi:MAG: cation:proton antiporter, partial [Cyanobacteria bacterium J06638_6]